MGLCVSAEIMTLGTTVHLSKPWRSDHRRGESHRVVSKFPCRSKTAFMKKPQRLEKTRPRAMFKIGCRHSTTDSTKEACAPDRKGFMPLSSPSLVDTEFLMRPSTLDTLEEEKEIEKKKKEDELDEEFSAKGEQVTLGHIDSHCLVLVERDNVNKKTSTICWLFSMY